jgi:hypothetical protein
MKLLYACVLFLVSFLPAGEGDPIAKTAELIRTANVEELSKSFAQSVEISVMGNEDVYPSAQAKAVLSVFFKENPPRTVKILHRITSNPNYRFAVIILTANNDAFRISFSLKKNREKFELTEITIEPEKK